LDIEGNEKSKKTCDKKEVVKEGTLQFNLEYFLFMFLSESISLISQIEPAKLLASSFLEDVYL